jgi:hypothetical protein
MKHRYVDQVKEGTKVKIRWIMNGTGEEVWYDAEVYSVKGGTDRYVVCNLIYEDGEKDIGEVLNEKDYGKFWMIPFYTKQGTQDLSKCMQSVVTQTEQLSERLKAHLTEVYRHLAKIEQLIQ